MLDAPEVEFESGNIAFLSENTVLEFYDLFT